jgi:hypothetical protein
VVVCLALIACVLGFIVLGAIEVIRNLWRLEVCSGLFFIKEKTEGKPSVHDQPERRSIIWIDSFTLKFLQDEDIDLINSIRVGLGSSQSNG